MHKPPCNRTASSRTAATSCGAPVPCTRPPRWWPSCARAWRARTTGAGADLDRLRVVRQLFDRPTAQLELHISGNAANYPNPISLTPSTNNMTIIIRPKPPKPPRTRVLVAEEIAGAVEREGPRVYGAARTTASTATGGGGGELLPQIARLVRLPPALPLPLPCCASHLSPYSLGPAAGTDNRTHPPVHHPTIPSIQQTDDRSASATRTSAPRPSRCWRSSTA
jgi:hypothetical protein